MCTQVSSAEEEAHNAKDFEGMLLPFVVIRTLAMDRLEHESSRSSQPDNAEAQVSLGFSSPYILQELHL